MTVTMTAQTNKTTEGAYRYSRKEKHSTIICVSARRVFTVNLKRFVSREVHMFGLSLTAREGWTAIHGLLATLAVIGFSGGLAGVWSLRTAYLSNEGLRERLQRLMPLSWLMAIALWAVLITGTWIVYPWYRAAAPEGTIGPALEAFPRNFLLSSPATAAWHTFGMELKEHIGWWSAFFATAAAFIIQRYGKELALDENNALRRVTFFLILAAFATTFLAYGLGAFITKVAPLI